MVDFSDREARLEWLKKQSREVCVAIAVRAALWVFPYAVLDVAADRTQKHNLTGSVKRAILISSVAANSPTDEIRDASAAASDAAADAAYAADAAAAYAAAAASADASAYAASAGAASAGAASAYASDAAYANAAAYASDAAAIDSGTLPLELLSMPLWTSKETMAATWLAARAFLERDPVDQSFWINWYERFLSGKPQNWEMMEEIALTLKPKDWETSSAHVNGMIKDIQDKYLRATTPLAEKVEVNKATNRLHIVPEPMSQKALYQNALEKVRDDIELFREGGLSNAHTALEKVFTRILDRTYLKYSASPQRVHDDFMLAHNRILRLIESGELADDEDVRDFLQVLNTGALDIRGAIKKVAEAVDKREQNRWRELSDAQRAKIKTGVEETAKASDPDMAEELREDGADALDKTLVDDDGNPDPIAVDARRRTSSRLPRALQALRGVGDGHSIGEITLAVTELFGLFGL